jgi:formate hydrogenlyase transcriptional activator
MSIDPRQQNVDPLLRRYQTLLAISEEIATHRDLNSLFQNLAQQLRPIVDFDGIGTFLYHPATHTMRVHLLESTMMPDLPFPRPHQMPVDVAPSGWVWKTQEPMIIYDAEKEVERYPYIIKPMLEQGVRSYCILPLTSAGRRLGALGFGSGKRATYNETDLEFLLQVARLVAVAIDNALNFGDAIEAQQHLAEERDLSKMLLDLNNAVVTSLDLQDLLTAISPCLRQVIHHDFAGLLLYDAENHLLRAHALDFPSQDKMGGVVFPIGGTPSGLAFTTRQPVIVTGSMLDKYSSTPLVQLLRAEGVKSGCSLPLLSHDRALGVLTLMSLRDDNVFTEEKKTLLMQIANQIAIAVDNALTYQEITALKAQLQEENIYLREEIRQAHDFEEIIGGSPALTRILRQVETVAPTDSTVLVQGETGTGKELIARAIHSLSARRERALVKLNCAAIPTGLLESELFGHEKGAFTGAITQRLGRFELAHKGTLFLDEVGEIPLELQPKLLRVLQEQEFERLGNSRTQRVDIRLVAATNRDLGRMAGEGRFRSDLYYRLNVFPITIPPLRERPEDIPLLIRFFANKFARRMKKHLESIPAEVVASLQQYHWPGNIRELENLIERAVILTPGTVLQIPLSEINLAPKPAFTVAISPARPTLVTPENPQMLEAVEREHILRILGETNWIVGGPNGAAARLGMKRTTLQARMRKLNIARQSN